MSSSSASLMPIVYSGDPTIRGLARLPAMMSATDVQQGAGSDTNAHATLTASQATFDTFSGGGGGSSSGGVDWGAFVQPVVNGLTNNGSTNASDATSSGASDCANVSFFSHPIDAITCVLDRTLFGLLALVLVGFGLYLFAKD